jgi:hypothetical protein
MYWLPLQLGGLSLPGTLGFIDGTTALRLK